MTAWYSPDRAELSEATREAMARGATLTRAAASEALTLAQPDLRGVFRTEQPVMVLPGDHGLAREIVLRSVVEQRTLVLVAGPEGVELADTSRALGQEVVQLQVHPGTVVEAEHLRRFLGGPDVDAVVLSCAELSLGTQVLLQELAAVVRQRSDLLLIADATGALGAMPIEMDQWGIDLLLTPSAGPLGLPPGFSLVAMSPRAVTRAQSIGGRGAYLDLLAHRRATERSDYLASFSPPLLLALRHQLRQILAEGMEARWSRHAMLRATVEQWVMVRNDLHPLAPPQRRTAAATCLRLPPESSAQRIVEGLADEEWPIAPDARRLPDDRLCVGHMGDVTEPELLRLLETIGRQLDAGR